MGEARVSTQRSFQDRALSPPPSTSSSRQVDPLILQYLLLVLQTFSTLQDTEWHETFYGITITWHHYHVE